MGATLTKFLTRRGHAAECQMSAETRSCQPKKRATRAVQKCVSVKGGKNKLTKKGGALANGEETDEIKEIKVAVFCAINNEPRKVTTAVCNKLRGNLNSKIKYFNTGEVAICKADNLTNEGLLALHETCLNSEKMDFIVFEHCPIYAGNITDSYFETLQFILNPNGQVIFIGLSKSILNETRVDEQLPVKINDNEYNTVREIFIDDQTYTYISKLKYKFRIIDEIHISRDLSKEDTKRDIPCIITIIEKYLGGGGKTLQLNKKTMNTKK